MLRYYNIFRNFFANNIFVLNICTLGIYYIGNNIELDTTFNLFKICCNYFLLRDFKTQIQGIELRINLINTLDIPFQIFMIFMISIFRCLFSF